MKPIRDIMHSPTEIQLAYKLANAFNDHHSMAFYLSCAKKYPHEYLIEQMERVCSLPDRAVRTTRARIFNSIVSNSPYNNGSGY